MKLSPQILAELEVFVYAVSFGALSAFLYDGILILRRVFAHTMFWCMTEDFFYWIMVIPCSLIAMFHWCQGVVTWYFLLGVFLGVILYKGGISVIYIDKTAKILQYIVVYIKRVVHIVEKPVIAVGNRVKSVFSKAEALIKKFTIIPKMWLTVCIKWFKITLCKHKDVNSQELSEKKLGDNTDGW